MDAAAVKYSLERHLTFPGSTRKAELAAMDKVEVEGPAAAVLGMELNLPDLAQRVGLDEVALVMHVEAVIYRMVLEVGHVSGHVDNCHRNASLLATSGPGDGDGTTLCGPDKGGSSGNVPLWMTPPFSRC